MPTLYTVLFTAQNEQDTVNTAYLTLEAAEAAGAALAPLTWEIEEIEIGDDVVRSLFLAVGNRSDVIAEAIGDAYAYRTESGELTEDDLEEADPEDDDLLAARRFRQLANELEMKVSPIHFS